MTDNNKKDLGPFDDEYFDDEDLASDSPKVSKEYVADDKEKDEDDFPDDVPAVSITKKKNIVLIAIIGLVALYFFYQFSSSDDRRTVAVPKNESEEMSDEFRQSAAVPDLSSEMMVVATKSPVKDETKDSALSDLIVAPPPPPLIEPSSQFTTGVGGLNSSNLGLPPLGVDGDRDKTVAEKLFGLDGKGGATGVRPGGSVGGSSGGGYAPLPTLGGELYRSSGGPGGGVGGAGVIVSEDYKARIQAEMFVQQTPDTEIIRRRSTDNSDLIDGNSSSYNLDSGYSLQISSASRNGATFVGNLNNIILQGKVIDAVIETAINTDLPDGILRGVVSRDVYSEKGNRILIPKGSRLIGNYNTDVKFGQARVFIIWTRVIRPDGIDAFLDSNATDLLGRRGVYGKLDNRFLEIFGSSILLSSISIAFAIAATEIADPPQSQSSTGSGGNVVQNTDPETEAIRESVEALGTKVGTIAEELLINKPRVTVDQGTRIKIFVNKDIHFPDSFAGEGDGVNIIQ